MLDLSISGVPIAITADSKELIGIFEEYFRYYLPRRAAGNPSEIPPIEIELRLDRTIPDSIHTDSAVLVTRAGEVELWRREDTDLFLFLTPGATFEIRPPEGRIRGLVSRVGIGNPHILANTWTLFPLLLAMRARGRYHLHSAAVLSPRNELWLICGPQRSGKTTLASALGLAGWRPIADDSVILRAGEGGPSLEALKKRFHLSRDLLEAWSGPAPDVPVYNDRACFEGLERFSALEAADRAYDRVSGIVLAGISGERTGWMKAVPASEGLIGLARESAFFPIWSEHVAKQWDLLSRVARQARSYRLSAGADILDDPLRAAELLTDPHLDDRT